MKIAITSTGPNLDDRIEDRFGRCPYFLIVDTGSMQYETIENPNIASGGGAGVKLAQLMADKEVKAVLTGNCGPNAYQVLSAAGIQVITGISGKMRDVVAGCRRGAFPSSSEASVSNHSGGDFSGLRVSSDVGGAEWNGILEEAGARVEAGRREEGDKPGSAPEREVGRDRPKGS